MRTNNKKIINYIIRYIVLLFFYNSQNNIENKGSFESLLLHLKNLLLIINQFVPFTAILHKE